MVKLSRFINKEILLLLVVLIVFLNPFLYGYRVAFLFAILIFLRFEYFTDIVDINLLYLLAFTMSYELFKAMRIDTGQINSLDTCINIIVPTLMYMIGKYLSINYRNSQILIFVLFFIAFSYAIVPIISIIKHIIQNSFIEGTRSIALIWDSNFELSATVLGSYFVLSMSSIGLVNVRKNTAFERSITWCFVLLFIFSLISVIRLGSRTMLVIALLSFLLSFFINIRHNSLIKNVVTVFILLIGAFFGIKEYNKNAELLTFYADRIGDDEAGIGSAGGRTNRWLSALDSITTDPFGWELDRFGYAHNLWLDVARVSGIIPLIALMLFTFSVTFVWLQCLKSLINYNYLRSLIFIYFISIILLFSVEPIMDGMYLFFLLFCMFAGVLQGIIKGV